MLAISTIFLLFVLSISNARTTFYQNCPIDSIDFATKVENSSYVVYGKSMSKTVYKGNDSMFHVKFQVDCIFKGPVIPREINITQAGQVEGKTYCQDFPVAHGYTIAFLESSPLNINDTETFIPADFVEVPFKTNVTDELLTNTCDLHQLLPFESSESIHDVCPAVSTNPQCSPIIELTSIGSDLHAVVIPNGSKYVMDNIRGKSGSIQAGFDTKSGVNSINISILLILMAILFVRLN